MTSVLTPRMLPIGIPLYTLLFSEIYLLFIPKSATMDSVLRAAMVVAFLCLPFVWFTLGGRRCHHVAEGVSREGDMLF
jgi:hypothetical protein